MSWLWGLVAAGRPVSDLRQVVAAGLTPICPSSLRLLYWGCAQGKGTGQGVIDMTTFTLARTTLANPNRTRLATQAQQQEEQEAA